MALWLERNEHMAAHTAGSPAHRCMLFAESRIHHPARISFSLFTMGSAHSKSMDPRAVAERAAHGGKKLDWAVLAGRVHSMLQKSRTLSSRPHSAAQTLVPDLLASVFSFLSIHEFVQALGACRGFRLAGELPLTWPQSLPPWCLEPFLPFDLDSQCLQFEFPESLLSRRAIDFNLKDARWLGHWMEHSPVYRNATQIRFKGSQTENASASSDRLSMMDSMATLQRVQVLTLAIGVEEHTIVLRVAEILKGVAARLEALSLVLTTSIASQQLPFTQAAMAPALSSLQALRILTVQPKFIAGKLGALNSLHRLEQLWFTGNIRHGDVDVDLARSVRRLSVQHRLRLLSSPERWSPFWEEVLVPEVKDAGGELVPPTLLESIVFSEETRPPANFAAGAAPNLKHLRFTSSMNSFSGWERILGANGLAQLQSLELTLWEPNTPVVLDCQALGQLLTRLPSLLSFNYSVFTEGTATVEELQALIDCMPRALSQLKLANAFPPNAWVLFLRVPSLQHLCLEQRRVATPTALMEHVVSAPLQIRLKACENWTRIMLTCVASQVEASDCMWALEFTRPAPGRLGISEAVRMSVATRSEDGRIFRLQLAEEGPMKMAL